MSIRTLGLTLAAGGACLLASCAKQPGADSASTNGAGNGHEVKVTVIEVGPDAQKIAQEALIMAEEGEVIEFAEGQFDFTSTLSLEDVEGVTIRGQGMDKTILNFKDQAAGTGGEGIKVGSGNFTLEDLTIQDAQSDGFKIEGVDRVIVRRVRAEWTGGADPNNGAYGIYPVLCKDVLIEECEVYAASDAGVYVGQSENVIVRKCRTERNVVGIEIENTIGADVYDNLTTNNAGGMAVFSLPELVQKVGRQCRVFNNQIFENNHENFAKKGNIVASVPKGTGLFIMANDEVEVFSNVFRDNQTVNLAVMSYLSTRRKYNDPEYDPYPESIFIHDNTFEGGGNDPQGEIGLLLGSTLGMKLPDIMFDGIVDKEKFVDDALPLELMLCIKNNGDADFVNSGMEAVLAGAPVPPIDQDLSRHEGEHSPLPEIVIEGIN